MNISNTIQLSPKLYKPTVYTVNGYDIYQFQDIEDINIYNIVSNTVFHVYFFCSLCLNFFHLLAHKPNLEKKKSIYSNKFIHSFESSFACPGLHASGLARRLYDEG